MKRNVLYVDDESDNIAVFEATFGDDFNIFPATSGPEALELLAEHEFPVVVADQRMPGMTGAALFEIMRRKHPHCKRIMLTGYADSSAMLDAINQGQVYYFLRKPWERDMLFSVVVRAIEAHDMSSANVALTERLLVADRCATLGHMAARVAHEMGNQLCMLPLLELIEEDYADQKPLVEMAGVTRMAYSRLVELINEVKAFARFDQREVPKQKVSLTEVIAELVDFLRYDKTLPLDRLVVHIHSEPVVMASKVKLQQVLLNLLKNAAYAIHDQPDGAISVTLDAAEGRAVLGVRDNGCGMSTDVAERIWEPFFTTKGKQGNGLGLDVVNSVIETYGGTIRCKTAPGEGAEFTISLPLDETPPAAAALPPGASFTSAAMLASAASLS